MRENSLDNIYNLFISNRVLFTLRRLKDGITLNKYDKIVLKQAQEMLDKAKSGLKAIHERKFDKDIKIAVFIIEAIKENKSVYAKDIKTDRKILNLFDFFESTLGILIEEKTASSEQIDKLLVLFKGLQGISKRKLSVSPDRVGFEYCSLS